MRLDFSVHIFFMEAKEFSFPEDISDRLETRKASLRAQGHLIRLDQVTTILCHEVVPNKKQLEPFTKLQPTIPTS